MSVNENEPKPDPMFGREQYTEDFYGEELTGYNLTINPEALYGFSTEVFSKEVVAGILQRTIEGMRQHGAAALGLDMESIAGTFRASDNLLVAMDVGANILNDFARRVTGETWQDWLEVEFPNAMAAIYGADSQVVEFARQEMGR